MPVVAGSGGNAEGGAEKEEEDILSCGWRRRLGIWPPTMASRSLRGDAGAASGR